MTHNEEIRSRVLELAKTLTDEQLNQKVHDDQWSIMQVMDHLYLMEKNLTNTMKKVLEGGEEQSVDDKPIHLTVDRSRKVDAPSYVVPSDEFITLDEMKDKLYKSRQALQEFEAETNEEKRQKKAFPHPVFGLMTVNQWIPFIGYHEERHLEQMKEIKQQLL
ncbi:DinB family protein [Priestia koreensis]|uniref:DinB family protein n=1 Tax=Priestia koreensis TaxID=284581 RepID=UPI00203CDDAD|nr:DinB family protein [Priestia koreensis]MCM3006005.1 DinB family protein [Priestia koreensis]